MKKYIQKDIRNVGLVGHGAAGKTSVAEAILFNSGVSDRLGRVGDNSSIMDYDPDEIKRGHSINASLAFLEWQGKKINLIDTPGTSNFVADIPGCLRVVDGALIVISAEAGVQYFTEKAWQWIQEFSLNSMIFINKVDHEQAHLDSVLESVKKRFKKNPALLQVTVGAGEGFSGIVDLVTDQYFSYINDSGGMGKSEAVPDSCKEEVESRKGELMESVAECDEVLVEKYLEGGSLSQEELASGLIKAVQEGELIPVLCGSATLNKGIDLLIQGMIQYLPSPDQHVLTHATSGKDKSAIELKPDENGNLSAQVCKTIADPYAGKLTLFRVFSGSVKTDSSVYNSSREANERVGQLFALQGKKQTQVTEVSAGDFATVPKLKVTETGDTLTTQEQNIIFEPIVFPKPVLSRAIIPKTRSDEEKISSSLNRLCEEDTTLKVERNQQTKELLVSGMGQVHLDVILERLKRRFGVEVDVKEPKVPYLETIRGSTKVQGKHKKQSGGRGQFADTWLEIEPSEKGDDYVFVNKIVGGAIPKQYIPAVEKGVHEAMAQGVLANYPMVDVKVTLYDGSFHNVDSSEMAFKIAGSIGFKKGVVDCKPVLLEPVMLMEVIVPSECVGDVMGDLNAKRGKILGIDAKGDTQNIRANVPMASVLNYASDLTSLTGGRGVFVTEFSYYEDVPDHLSSKVIAEANKEKEQKKD
ncbi:MAG: elongation factor G [Nitrospinota bacterium]|nr:elongation factor G [Nitrospinota bacterium]